MTFNKMKIALASSALVALAMGSTGAQAATDTATATANILEVVTVSQSANLNFGTIVPDDGAGTSGTVAIASNGTRTCAANLVCSLASTAAAFDVTGSNGQTVDVSVPASVTLTSGGGDTMSSTLAGSVASILLDGTDAFNVGGTLTVAAAQASGSYTGTFTVTVNYQ